MGTLKQSIKTVCRQIDEQGLSAKTAGNVKNRRESTRNYFYSWRTHIYFPHRRGKHNFLCFSISLVKKKKSSFSHNFSDWMLVSKVAFAAVNNSKS